jgi:hydroxypyruvate isomerase
MFARERKTAMLRFAANLGMLFGDVEFLDRFAEAADAGFSGVEYPVPYAYPKEQLAALLDRHRLTQVLFNLPAGDATRDERGIACHPDRQREFQDGVGLAIEYARALRCAQVNCLAGLQPNISDDLARATLIDNLRFAAHELDKAGVRLLIEAINTRDMPRFFLSRSAQARALLDAVGSDNLWLQYDVYHMQGDLTPTIRALLPRIAHFQIADNPGRHEPGTGEIHFPFLLREIERLGYAGWIGCEYRPRGTTREGLGWLTPYTQQRSATELESEPPPAPLATTG